MYEPLPSVVTVTSLVLQPNTNTTVFPPNPVSFAVRVPETVIVVPLDGFDGVAEAVREVDTGFVSDPIFRFNVIVPGPINGT